MIDHTRAAEGVDAGRSEFARAMSLLGEVRVTTTSEQTSDPSSKSPDRDQTTKIQEDLRADNYGTRK